MTKGADKMIDKRIGDNMIVKMVYLGNCMRSHLIRSIAEKVDSFNE